jgi:signal transduction histidine kinase
MTTEHAVSTVREKLHALLTMERPILRAQLALLYSGFFLGLLVVALGAAGLLILRGSQSASSNPGPAPGPSPPTALLVLGIGLVAAAVAVTGAWWLAGRFLRPLRAITTTAQEISATNLHRRLELKGPDDELTQLGKTLDDLFGRLETSFEAQRRFVANASHELRTPLAGQRTLLQVALSDPGATTGSLRETCEQALELTNHQARLIDSLLTLATSERGLERSQPLDLAEVTAAVLADRQQAAESQGIAIETSLARCTVTGDHTLLESLVANLVDNAVRHNVSNGSISILTATAKAGPSLTVLNTGPLVPDSAIGHLFEPFRTSGADRVRRSNGHGLGLAIIRAIADAHNATVDVQPRASGGLEITITFPTV